MGMDIDASNWNEDDAANTTAAPDGAPEGMRPSGVNNVLRAIMGALKRRRNWGSPRITGGTSSAYTLTYTVAPGALVDGMTHLVQFSAANGNAPTLNVNTLGALPLYYHAAGAWRAAPPGLVDVDEIWRVAYHASSGTYRLLDLRNRTGEVVPFAGSAAPAGALLSYGQAVSRTTYAGLFAMLGTAYGAGDGSATFNLPDLRGRLAAGKSDMGGSDAGTLTGGGVLGAGLGGQTSTATTTINSTGSAVGSVVSDGAGQAEFRSAAGPQEQQVTLGHTHAVHIDIPVTATGAGTSGAFGIVQPTRVLNYLIRI
jgi:microcystin-dependent protein